MILESELRSRFIIVLRVQWDMGFFGSGYGRLQGKGMGKAVERLPQEHILTESRTQRVWGSGHGHAWGMIRAKRAPEV